MELSILILNYKTAAMTADCIHSVRNAITDELDYEILVADNDSQDGSFEILQEAFSGDARVRVIHNQHNLGFSKGNNKLAKQAKGEYVLLLNSDTLVEDKRAIIELVRMMKEDPAIGISACKLLNEDRTLQISYAKMPGILDVMAEYFLGYLTNRYKHPFHQAAQVDMVIGAFMILRRSTFMEVGMFDERYHFNVEDVDLCKSVRNKGLKVVYVPEYAIIHFGGKSQGGIQWVNNWNLHQNRIKYYEKHYSFPISFLAKGSILFGIKLQKLRKS